MGLIDMRPFNFSDNQVDRHAPRKPRLLRLGRGELYEIAKNPYREGRLLGRGASLLRMAWLFS